MYGLILDSMSNCIKHVYGDKIWQSVVGTADISSNVFTTHKIYDEQLIPMIANATSDITGIAIETFMETAGRHFINYIAQIRNDRITKVLGRTLKDFLIGLDCMHEYYRTTFNEIQSPSFHVANEDSEGLEIHYRSRRTFTGFMYYVQGLLHAIAEQFFSTDVAIQITQHGFTGDAMLAVYRLNFRNTEFLNCQRMISIKRGIRSKNNLTFPMDAFFELFPFHVVFDERLLILSTGHGLDIICRDLQRKRLNETFFMTRPLGCDLTWDNVLIHSNNVFELTSVKSSGRSSKKNEDTPKFLLSLQTFDLAQDFRHSRMQTTHFIKLRGQMLYIEEWGLVIFLATFMMDDLNKLHDLGTFVNDLTFHDLSRDMVLHGPQQTTEYKLALDLEQGKNSRLEKMIENLGCNQRKIDDLLYSMIPKEIASSLRQGNTSVSLCEKYQDVTILFSDVVNFAKMCRCIEPHEIMKTLNTMIGIFDKLCIKFNTYKVETVADGFMCVSGAPSYDELHAKNMADMAIEMLKNVQQVLDPKTGNPIQIRIGLHCGAVIAGLVGHKIPRYCLFGNTVHIASKLESSGMSQRIHISDRCMEYLSMHQKYKLLPSDALSIKGRKVETYWLEENPAYEETLPIAVMAKQRPEKKIGVQLVGKVASHGKVEVKRIRFEDEREADEIRAPQTHKPGKAVEQAKAQPAKQEFGNPPGGALFKQSKNEKALVSAAENRSGYAARVTTSPSSAKKNDLQQWSEIVGMDDTCKRAYENLMRSIGIQRPLNVIIRRNNGVLSASPRASLWDHERPTSILQKMLESEKPRNGLPDLQSEKAFCGGIYGSKGLCSSVCIIM